MNDLQVTAHVVVCVCVYTQGQYLLCYDNGKSAVRLDCGPVVPLSVHKWSVPDPKKAFTALGAYPLLLLALALCRALVGLQLLLAVTCS